MKQNIIKAGLTLAVAASSLTACIGNYLEINTNPYEVSKDQMLTDGYATGAALKALCSSIISTDVNTAQFTECLLGGPMGGYYSTTGGFDATIDNFNAKNDWTRVMMMSDRIIPNMYSNLQELKSLTEDPVTLAIGEVLKVAIMHRITDTYGPIYYTQLGQGGKLTVPYDSQEDVYNAMVADLDKAIKDLTDNRLTAIPAKIDPVFDGTPVAWAKFANSLKLRIAMRMVYADRQKAQKYAEEAVNHEIGVMTSNADNAYLKRTAFGEKGNPIYTAVKYNQPQGCITGGDTHVAADIVYYMNGYNDPRREIYFTKSEFENVDYVGIRVSIKKPALNTIGRKYSGLNITEADPLLWLNAAEVCFLRAEGKAVFGFNLGASAADLYNEGVRLSFEERGAKGYEDYINDDVNKPGVYTDPAGLNSYAEALTQLTVKWDETATADQKQERILIQKWIANFNLGNEAWAEHRRTGYPVFFPATAEGNGSSGKVDNVLGARRMVYPQEESTNNGENLAEAIKMLGGADEMSTPLWWDCNPRIWTK